MTNFERPELFEMALEENLRRFHEAEPKFPADPNIQAQRLDLLKIDPVFQGLKKRYDTATGQSRLELYGEMANYRWSVITTGNLPGENPVNPA